jgi:hypothetical protein
MHSSQQVKQNGGICMGDYLNVGNAGFATMIKENYVDKTGLISYVNKKLGTTGKLMCVSRPRRFGKSYAAKMLCAYYDKSCNSEELFEGYNISSDKSYRTYMNKYDVIYLDITWFISISKNIKNIVNYMQQEVIRELREAYPDAQHRDSLAETLAQISDITGNKFIIIIDEWDALFREVKHDTELQNEYIRFLRSMFKSSGHTDKMIEAAYITGILPIKKYGTQSALTDFVEYTMTQPAPIEEYVGFTECEVRLLCENSNISFEEIKKWYDGYILGENTHIYSPKSVMDALERKRVGNYWTQSETYESLKIYIDLNEDGLKESIVQMLGGANIKIDVLTFQNDMTSIKNRDDVLTLLIHLGYLAYSIEDKTVYIPNEEVRQEFVRAVEHGSHKEIARLIKNSDLLLEQTLNMDEEAVAESIETAHSSCTSPTYYNNEQALRSVIKFAYITCVDKFLQIEELPSGTGYADVVYIPKQGTDMPAILIELKWNKGTESAIKQIKDRNYPQVLENYGADILLVGINYDEKTKKHTCHIEKYRET